VYMSSSGRRLDHDGRQGSSVDRLFQFLQRSHHANSRPGYSCTSLDTVIYVADRTRTMVQ
jgi:hypothetical protein